MGGICFSKELWNTRVQIYLLVYLGLFIKLSWKLRTERVRIFLRLFRNFEVEQNLMLNNNQELQRQCETEALYLFICLFLARHV